MLADVKVKEQKADEKLYCIAYVTASGDLYKHYAKLTFAEAVAVLGYTGATNSITQQFTPKKWRGI